MMIQSYKCKATLQRAMRQGVLPRVCVCAYVCLLIVCFYLTKEVFVLAFLLSGR